MREKISILNYELFFIRYAEGEMTDAERLEVETFLQRHPYLKGELEDTKKSMLRPDEDTSLDLALKNNLRKNEKDLLPERFADFNEFAFALLEAGLNENEQRLFERLLANNDEKKRSFDIFKACVLQADTNIEYPDKKSLKYESITAMPERFRNFDAFIFAATEGELSPHESEMLKVIISQDKQKEREYLLMQRCKLSADERLIFRNKNKLRKKAPVIRMPRRVLYPLSAVAAAAAILLIFLIPADVGKLDGTALLMPAENEAAGDVVPIEKKAEEKEVILATRSSMLPKVDRIINQPKQIPTDDVVVDKVDKDGGQHTLTVLNDVMPEPDKIVAGGFILEKQAEGTAAIEPVVAAAKNIALDEFLLREFRRRLLEEEAEESQQRRFSLWDIADVALRGTASVLGREWHLDKEYDEEGKIRQIAFNSQMLSFNAPVNQR